MIYVFSSNSCNFVHSSNRLKHDCPKEFVFCAEKDSKPVLIAHEMTFQTASNYCSNGSSHICESSFWVISPFLKTRFSDTPKNFEEISRAFKRNNLSDTVFTVWTDLERMNLTHFRKSRPKFQYYSKYTKLSLLLLRKSIHKKIKIKWYFIWHDKNRE